MQKGIGHTSKILLIIPQEDDSYMTIFIGKVDNNSVETLDLW
jgi:hypothetical protein